jgi:hypothetical protein
MGTAILKTIATCIIQRNARPKERYRNETHLQKKIQTAPNLSAGTYPKCLLDVPDSGL